MSEDIIFAVEIGRMLSAVYFIYNRKTKTFETDYRLSTKLMIVVKMIALTFTVYLSFPSYEEVNLTILFQILESITTYILSMALFVVNYICQKYAVRTFRALMQIERLLLQHNVPQSKNFKNSLRRLLLLITFAFAVIVVPPFLYSALNDDLDLLSCLIALMALISFYKTLSCICIFLVIWYYFLTINKCLEKATIRSGKCCQICDFNDSTVLPKEKLCKRHLI